VFGIGGKIETVIGEGALVKGGLAVSGAVYVDGHVMGDVESDSIITLGDKAEVEGSLCAPMVVVGGKLRGDVRASIKVELLGTAIVGGDIHSPKLSVAEGALFQGNCEMTPGLATIVDFKAIKNK
jgi:cytoskeletal protein CcmA (bactofilin family)